MNIDFYEQYRHLSNIDLLLIAKEPEKYQAAAVAVAIDLLSNRSISDEDIYEAESRISEENEKILASRRANPFIQASVELPKLFKILRKRNDPENAEAWVKVLIAIQFIGLVFSAMYFLGDMLQYFRIHILARSGSYFWIFVFGFPMLSILINTTLFVLFYRRMRWGWILLLALQLMNGVVCCYSFVGSVYYFFGAGLDTVLVLLFRMLLIGGISVLLLRPDIAAIFNVDRKTRRTTLLAGLGIGVGLQLMIYLLLDYSIF